MTLKIHCKHLLVIAQIFTSFMNIMMSLVLNHIFVMLNQHINCVHYLVTNHFYTTDADAIGTTVVGEIGTYNQKFDGIEVYLFEAQIDSTVPSNRFYYSHGGSNDHAYRTSCSIGLSGYTYEGVRGYSATDLHSIDSVCCPYNNTTI